MKKTKKRKSLNRITPGLILAGSGPLVLGVASAIWLAGMTSMDALEKYVSPLLED